MKLNLKRREFTTNGPDPTVVVEYEDKKAGVRITEFQGVYTVDRPDQDTHDPRKIISMLAEELHRTLEEAHEVLQSMRRLEGWPEDNDSDVEAAERKAGWDPKP